MQTTTPFIRTPNHFILQVHSLLLGTLVKNAYPLGHAKYNAQGSIRGIHKAF